MHFHHFDSDKILLSFWIAILAPPPLKSVQYNLCKMLYCSSCPVGCVDLNSNLSPKVTLIACPVGCWSLYTLTLTRGK